MCVLNVVPWAIDDDDKNWAEKKRKKENGIMEGHSS
jgi:hypothetical protein